MLAGVYACVGDIELCSKLIYDDILRTGDPRGGAGGVAVAVLGDQTVCIHGAPVMDHRSCRAGKGAAIQVHGSPLGYLDDPICGSPGDQTCSGGVAIADIQGTTLYRNGIPTHIQGLTLEAQIDFSVQGNGLIKGKAVGEHIIAGL